MTIADLLRSMDYGAAPENATAARAWLDERDGSLRPFIDGTFQDPLGGGWLDTHEPATGERLGRVAACSPADVDLAVSAARRAQPVWWALGGHARARFLYALARQVQKHARLLAVLESLDNGKPIRETRDIDVPLVARHFLHHAGWAQLLESEFEGHEPLGVAGQIIPWNFPLLMLAWKVAPALATGNTIVLKPAELTSVTAVAFAELCARVGLPPGVFNLVTGDGETGACLVEHPEVDKIAFTGSTEVGRRIREVTAGSGKRISLELGGKSPFVVFEDADLDGAIEGVVDAIWLNQGEVCCAGSRLLVQEGVAATFYERLRARMERLRVGDPLDKGTDIGAVVSPAQLERIRALVARGEAEGGRAWQPAWQPPTRGCFHPPVLITDVAPAATVAQEEIFGPVLVSMTFRTPDEAVALANDTRYGLAASVWTESGERALDVAARIQAGTVWINSTNLFDAAAGFGGRRESGFGREGGREGLWEYLRPATTRPPLTPASGPPAPAGPRAAVIPDAPRPPIDRTAKLYIGGRQVRPDGGATRAVCAPDGSRLGDAGEGGPKDVRGAVEAASAAGAWGRTTGHARAQVLYFVAENLAARREEFSHRLGALQGGRRDAAAREVDLSIERLFHWAAWTDKFDGRVHDTAARTFTFAVHEPVGTIGILCPDSWPLLAFCSTVFAAVALGNTVVVVPSPPHPWAATDLYQVLDTSDVPAGVVNIVTGDRARLGGVLAAHDAVGAVWHFGAAEEGAAVERASAGNLKRTWVEAQSLRAWDDPHQGATKAILRQAVHGKSIWVPYGA